jgi:NADH:ubiquinone reductase (H+-translocating)
MKVVIIGAGFGGLKLARMLNNKPGFDVVLIDRFNYHQFQPLFYQVATAGLDASNISFPLRKVFHKSRNVRVRLATVSAIEAQLKTVSTDIGDFKYDVLVLATGADTNFFGNTQLQEMALPMKSTVEALQIRHRLIQNFEDALVEKDPVEIERLLTVVLVGGGPTGVEMSGAIAEMRNLVLPKDYPELDFTKMRILLIESSPKTLGAMSEKSSAQSREYLERLGVTVMTGRVVQEYDGKTVVLKDGERIAASTVIWAAGIKANVPAGIDTSLVTRGNRVKTDRHSMVLPDVYAIGDVAYMETPLYPQGHPQVAQVAIQQAHVLGKNLMRMESKSGTIFEFEYYDKGVMATVGKNLAVVDLPKPKIHFSGWFAWLIWMTLHLMLILGVKNRLFVFLNWFYNYVTSDQSLRLIFNEYYRPRQK